MIYSQGFRHDGLIMIAEVKLGVNPCRLLAPTLGDFAIYQLS
jgi:hypothetical protein